MTKSEAIRDLSHKLFLQMMTNEKIAEAILKDEKNDSLYEEADLAKSTASDALSLATYAVDIFEFNGVEYD
jgi:hypothetical protein